MGQETENVDDGLIHCWCGAIGTFEELFDMSGLASTCGGSGTLDCECGGDNLCVCHLHGGVDCDGCEDCRCNDDHDEWD